MILRTRTVDGFSERRADGSANGIPVFKEPWKNVVATLYHELQEARTDPDVEDAIRDPYNPNAERYLGWTSDRGEECGDYPISGARQISNIVTEMASPPCLARADGAARLRRSAAPSADICRPAEIFSVKPNSPTFAQQGA